MLSILRKTASSMARSSGSDPSVRYDVVDLSTWELVDASPSDDDDLYSFDGDDGVTSDRDDVIEPAIPMTSPEDEDEDARAARDLVSPVEIRPSPIRPPIVITCANVFGNIVNRGYNDGLGDYDADDVDDGDEYDDELLPWKLKDRFGKQRIKKLGKRGGPKANKAKRLPIYHNRPGCLYGKHGYGVQHSFV